MSILNHLFGDEKHQAGEPAQSEAQASDVIISPDTRRANRIPPGQSRTRKWPVLDAYGPPNIDLANWRLEVFGLVEKPITLTLDELKALPQVKVFSDFHCVTRWSRLGNLWEGMATRALADRVQIKPAAQFVLAHAYDKLDNQYAARMLHDRRLVAHAHARWATDFTGTRRAGAPDDPAVVCLEKRQMDSWD